jgi:hypothetical protein
MHSYCSDGGARRNGEARTDAHRFYARLGLVASHEGMKLSLDRE